MLESEDVYERQNAAVVFGFYMLEEFYQGLASGYTMVLDRLQLESGVAHDIDSWPAYKDTWDRLTLIRTFVNAIPSVMPVSRLEGVLRILLLYEAVVVIDPREFALRRTADPGVSEVLDLWWEPYTFR